MNKKLLLAVGLVALACACQPKKPGMQQDDQDARRRQSGRGCCEVEKPQATAPVTEQKTVTPAPQVAPQSSQATVATPEVKVESKTP